MLTALVIDDEQFAREELAEQLLETGLIEVIGDASNAIIGLKKINELKPDVVFLDIQMPQVTGIELLSMLDPDTMPQVVFVTAYDQYAIQAFEDNAFDYLLKPVEPKRLLKTLQRLNKQSEKVEPKPHYSAIAPERLIHIPCVGHHRILLIPIEQVECVYSDLSGVHVRSDRQSASTQLTLKTLEDKTTLVRCHRQYLVSVHHISEIKLLENGLAEIITLSQHTVPISRRYLKNVKELIGIGA
ncbi:two-component system response regulator BtsR [Enterovibrio norvegicus]|uniref:Two-component system response regulator YehT n=1 Tax=Enterovibrio norvegicus TaxID=188144 RepID=A0A2N7L8J6_9GAMM|nr:two-component system response regulator BtsR [Enterovibrio norvegicus]PML77407.1 two-component system response regulator YehT [Enterovibrio norvegicus]PMN90475.1 two-component system response regulator YehT [Enterovibrio norvegicus]